MTRSNEPIFWSLFSGGGVVAAFLIPITLVLTAIAVPAGWLATEGLRELLAHPLARLYLFVLISLPMFHGAHRFRHAGAELGLERLGGILAVVCYGSAVVATVLAAYFLTSF